MKILPERWKRHGPKFIPNAHFYVDKSELFLSQCVDCLPDDCNRNLKEIKSSETISQFDRTMMCFCTTPHLPAVATVCIPYSLEKLSIVKFHVSLTFDWYSSAFKRLHHFIWKLCVFALLCCATMVPYLPCQNWPQTCLHVRVVFLMPTSQTKKQNVFKLLFLLYPSSER